MDSSDSSANDYRLGSFVIKGKENVLSSDDGDTVVSPKVMTMLLYLCRHSQQVVTFDELVSAIWPREVVGDNAIYNLVGQLRKALGDSASKPVYIQTVSKVGYRLLLNAKPLLSDATSTNTHPSEAISEPAISTQDDSPPSNKKSSGIGWLLPFTLVISLVVVFTTANKKDIQSSESERQLKVANYQLNRGDVKGLDQAMDSLQQLIAAEPSWLLPKVELAYVFMRKARLAPEDYTFWINKARAIGEDDTLENAGVRLTLLIDAFSGGAQDFSELNALFSDESVLPSERLAFSTLLFDMGKTKAALEQATQALEMCMDCPYAYRKLADAQVVLGMVTEGFDSFSRYRMLVNNSNNNPADNAGYVPLNRQSAQDMANWLSRNPLPGGLLDHQRNSLALFYLSIGNISAADAILRTSAKTATHFFDLYTHAAIAGAKSDFETSYFLLNKRQRLFPDNDRFKLSVVFVLWQLRRYDDAINSFGQFQLLPEPLFETLPESLPEIMPFPTWSL